MEKRETSQAPMKKEQRHARDVLHITRFCRLRASHLLNLSGAFKVCRSSKLRMPARSAGAECRDCQK